MTFNVRILVSGLCARYQDNINDSSYKHVNQNQVLDRVGLIVFGGLFFFFIIGNQRNCYDLQVQTNYSFDLPNSWKLVLEVGTIFVIYYAHDNVWW